MAAKNDDNAQQLQGGEGEKTKLCVAEHGFNRYMKEKDGDADDKG